MFCLVSTKGAKNTSSLSQNISFDVIRALFDASSDKADLLREMIRVLGKSRDSALISENLEFILSYDIEIGQELFNLIPLSVMFPGYELN
jgi:hypothetical protein